MRIGRVLGGVAGMMALSVVPATAYAEGATAAFPVQGPPTAAPNPGPGAPPTNAPAPPPPAVAPSAPPPPPPGPPPPALAPAPVYSAGPAPAPAPAEPPLPEPAPVRSRPARSISIEVSPFRFILPALEVLVEARLVDHLGLSFIGGFGSITAEAHNADGATRDITFGYQEGGGQISWYPLEAFDSLNLGLEVLYIHLTGNLDNVTGAARGLAVGPFVGYKLITRGGFTLLVQGGVAYLAAHAETSNTAGASATSDQTHWLPLVNFNLGWSF